MHKKSVLSAAAIAAIASGAPLLAVENQAEAEQGNKEQLDAAAVAAALAAAGAAAGAAKTPEQLAADAAAIVTATAEAATATAAAAAAAATTVESELVKFLRTELATAQANLTANAVKIAGMEASVASAATTQPKLLEIARGAVKKMRIALGASGDGADVMSAEEVITAHAETSATFAKKFVVGGAAATSASADTSLPSDAKVIPMFAQAAKAAK